MTQAQTATANGDTDHAGVPALCGVPASAVIAPGSEQECAELVRDCAGRGAAIVPWGGGTCMHVGEPLRSPAFTALSLSGMADRITVQASDSLVTCAAGVRFAQLADALAEEGQELPLDPPQAAHATVGGVAASDAYGVLRSAHGSVRDVVVALRMVIGTGEVVAAGAKVVKNAAGYDTCRLVTGSRGTLAVITEVTFRTRPRARSQTHLAFRVPDADASVHAVRSLSSVQADTAYMAVVGRGATEGPFTLLVGVSGTTGHVQSVTRNVRSLVASGNPSAVEHDPALSDEEAETGRTILHGINAGAAIRVILPPDEAHHAIPKLASHGEEWVWLPRSGIVAARTRPGDPARDASFVSRLATEWPPPTSRLWLRLPDTHAGLVPVFGGYESALPLIRAIKCAFDPVGVLSPGRLAGAL